MNIPNNKFCPNCHAIRPIGRRVYLTGYSELQRKIHDNWRDTLLVSACYTVVNTEVDEIRWTCPCDFCNELNKSLDRRLEEKLRLADEIKPCKGIQERLWEFITSVAKNIIK